MLVYRRVLHHSPISKSKFLESTLFMVTQSKFQTNPHEFHGYVIAIFVDSHIFSWLVVYLPLWKIWKSVGMIIPNIWKNKSHVPNHQPVIHSPDDAPGPAPLFHLHCDLSDDFHYGSWRQESPKIAGYIWIIWTSPHRDFFREHPLWMKVLMGKTTITGGLSGKNNYNWRFSWQTKTINGSFVRWETHL